MKKLLFAPVLFVAGFILNLYLGNITELSLSILIVPICFGIIGALILTLVLSLVFKSKLRGVILASVMIISLFAAPDIAPKMDQMMLLLVCTGVVVILGIYLWRTKRNLVGVGKFLLITSVLISTIAAGRIVMAEVEKSKQEKVESQLKLPVAIKKDAMPDIYYIVPDSYSASESLKKYYGFDNGEFENFLTQKGFYIASDSASNYPKTFLSLGSSLNMEYLDYLSAFKNSTDLTKVDPLMEDNNVVKFLKSLGYKYYHLGSWWGATKTNHNADQNIILENENPIPLSQFDYIVMQSTILDPVLDKFLPNIAVGDSDLDRMNRTNYQFQKLGEVAFLPGPKFVFAHVIAPHEPYFYDANCQHTKPSVKNLNDEYAAYVAHLTCVNRKLEKSVEEILQNSKRPPVIIIQSDEGAPFLAEELKPVDAWGKAPESLLQEKFPVFNAYFLPEGESDLYPEISPVNSFRLVFNRYLGTDFPKLPDRSYILPDLQHLYDFVDISDKIK